MTGDYFSLPMEKWLKSSLLLKYKAFDIQRIVWSASFYRKRMYIHIHLARTEMHHLPAYIAVGASYERTYLSTIS